MLCSSGLILQCDHYLAAYPAAVWGQSGPGSPGGSGSEPECSSRSDSTECAAGQPGDLPHPGPNSHCYWTDPMADLPGNLQVVCGTFAYVSMAYRSFLWALFNRHVVFSCCERALLTCIPSVSVGSRCPVTPGTPVAPGAGAGPAADLSPSPDSPAGPNRPGQPAQPPHSHSELCNTIWSSIHTRGGCKQSSWYVTPAHTCTFSRTANLKFLVVNRLKRS